jgi:hypothetical protein
MILRLVGKSKLRFDDESEFQVPDIWARALNDKLVNEKLTLPEFLSEFDKVLNERWKSKTASDIFSSVLGERTWAESDGLREGAPYNTLADLAENELYYYLRGYIFGQILNKETDGKCRAPLLTDHGIIRYPKKKQPTQRRRNAVRSNIASQSEDRQKRRGHCP